MNAERLTLPVLALDFDKLQLYICFCVNFAGTLIASLEKLLFASSIGKSGLT